MLGCGHTFCHSCLTQVQRVGGAGALPCPSCREPTRPPKGRVDRLPKNFALIVEWGA